jgi:uncharacterized protein YndB with AHSA1/START domain
MSAIKHNLVIKATPEKVFEAVTTQEGIENWWCKNTIAKPELGFVNIFIFGKFRNEMKVSELIANSKVQWNCIDSIEEWRGTHVSFDMEEKNGNTLLRFTHGGWKTITDTFAYCSYDWALFMKSLKSFCETGTGSPS